jgi:hypothetical protein
MTPRELLLLYLKQHRTDPHAPEKWHAAVMGLFDEREAEEVRQLRAERDAWKDAAEHQYGLLRASLYGESGEDYPVQGALDAWAAGRYPAIDAARAAGETT